MEGSPSFRVYLRIARKSKEAGQSLLTSSGSYARSQAIFSPNLPGETLSAYQPLEKKISFTLHLHISLNLGWSILLGVYQTLFGGEITIVKHIHNCRGDFIAAPHGWLDGRNIGIVGRLVTNEPQVNDRYFGSEGLP